MNLGGPELIVVLVVVVLLFGSSQLPRLARSIGEAQSEFRQGSGCSEKADNQGDLINQA